MRDRAEVLIPRQDEADERLKIILAVGSVRRGLMRVDT
jgi:hypothetical protein